MGRREGGCPARKRGGTGWDVRRGNGLPAARNGQADAGSAPQGTSQPRVSHDEGRGCCQPHGPGCGGHIADAPARKGWPGPCRGLRAGKGDRSPAPREADGSHCPRPSGGEDGLTPVAAFAPSAGSAPAAHAARRGKGTLPAPQPVMGQIARGGRCGSPPWPSRNQHGPLNRRSPLLDASSPPHPRGKNVVRPVDTGCRSCYTIRVNNLAR